MKKTILAFTAAAAALVSVAATANAAPYQSINQRQSNLYHKIEQGTRNGALTRNEAANLRTRFVSLQRLEQQYRRGGLSNAERNDLNRRFTALNNSIRVQKQDRQKSHRR